MKKTTPLVAAVALTALAALSAFAEEPKEDPKVTRVKADVAGLFKKFDLDEDGRLSREEYHGKSFDQYDTNYDGVLTQAEMTDAFLHPQKREARLNKQDTDGDGVVTRQEFTGDDAAFERLDANHDGVLSDADKHVSRNAVSRETRFKSMDLNGDGVLTRDEWRGAEETFHEKDTNGDHVLTMEELAGPAKNK